MQGKTISGYTLQRPLGTGGMAEVWYAENKIGKNAAVKMLLPKLCQDENVVSRFLTEAKVMVDLNHPNIRQVYDYGDIDGRPAIVMEYLDGSDLKARMKRGQRFTEEELERWWNQLVDALNYTHKKGIVHRDIKPGNIFVNKEGNIKLLDFGIAKVRESISSTQTGQKLGTLMYMSPEQVKDSKHIDYKTDVYSLAVTFVHLLTGKKPYDSDTSSDFEISEKIVYKPLDMSGVPAEWQGFLAPYLEKSPEKRPELRRYAFDEDDATMVDGGESETFETEEGVATSGFAWDPIFGMRQTTAMGNIPSDVDPMPEDESDLNEEETIVEGAEAKSVASKPRQEPERMKTQTSDSSGEKPKKKTGLWIGLGVAGVVALLVLFFTLGDDDKNFVRGEAFYKAENYTEAWPLLYEVAQKGNARAQFYVGRMYDRGFGVNQDYAKALEWYRKSAEQGDASAQNNLGSMYDHGDGVEENDYEAVKWYRKSAEQGTALAQKNLGYMYANGEGLEQSYEQAAFYFEKAAEQGDSDAEYWMGYMNRYGLGMEQHFGEALKWLRLSADKGNDYAKAEIGHIYYYGDGVEQDYAEALKWYRQAADADNSVGLAQLAYMYAHGQGVIVDYNEAFSLTQKAANLNNPVAQYNLGLFYENGLCVNADEKEAQVWYQKAADNGHEEAKEALERLKQK